MRTPHVQVSAGSFHTCAGIDATAVLCWGLDDSSQLGGGTPGPVGRREYVEGAAHVARVEVGGEHSCLVRDDGTLLCWGHNGNGQIGDGTTRQRWAPVPVDGLDGTVLDVSIGRYHTCTVLGDRSVRCWGRNAHGQIGDGTLDDALLPREVDGLTEATAIAAGERHTCVLHTDGTVSCWGDNSSGQLGDGTTVGRRRPVPVPGVDDAVAITAGDRHTCVITAGRTLRCWGRNGFRQLGDGTTTDRTGPVDVSDVRDVRSVTAGEHHTCALVADGRALCWGRGSAGQLGAGTLDGVREDLGHPPVAVLLDGVTAIDAGGVHTCAVARERLYCWGSNTSSQLGDLGTSASATPVLVDLAPYP